MAETIIDVNTAVQYKKDGQLFAIYALMNRFVTDYRDGLKPIHRRLLYSMYAVDNAIDHTVKSSRVVGSVIGKFHPHGDAAAYGAVKPLTNWFEINKPLIDSQGEFGSIMGNTAAAMRYTEIKLSKFAKDCSIGELKETKSAVDWVYTYDGSMKEPKYLPTTVPMLLINGAFGMGPGLKVEIPRHNINEVIDATIKLIHNPDAQITLIPDHCMPCEIIQTNFKSISNKGHGHYKVRGLMSIGERKGYPTVIIETVPDITFMGPIRDKIEDMVKENKLIQVQDIIEENDDKQNITVAVILKKGSDPNYVKDVIYKHTEMEQTRRVNFQALDGVVPQRFSYKSYLQAFIDFRKLTKFRLYCNQLQDVQTKMHEMELYIKVIQTGEIDTIYQTIRKQKTTDHEPLIEYLIKKLDVTDLQAKFLLTIDLAKVSDAYMQVYVDKRSVLEIEKNAIMAKILDDRILLQEIEDDLLEYKKKYGNPRRCKVITESEASGIPQGEFKVIITENNFIKKIPVNDTIGAMRGDNPKIVIKAENSENILIFDELGKVYKLPVHRIQFSDRNSPGIDIRILIKNLTANINSVIYEPTIKEFANKQNKYFLTVVTKNGYIKKLDLDDFLMVQPSGIIFIKMDDGDSVKDTMIIGAHSDIIVYSSAKALRMNMSEVPHLKRSTKGNRVWSSDRKVDGISIIKNDTTDIVVITEGGKINRFSPAALPLSTRGKAGVNVISLSKGDSIKAIYGLNINDSIRIVSTNDKLSIPVKDIPEGSSISGGSKIFSTRGNSIIRCDLIRG